MPWFAGRSLQTFSAILTLAGLAACGGKEPSTPSQPDPDPPTLPPLNLALAPVEAADYAAATPEQLLRHLRNGLRVQLTGWGYNASGVQAEPGTTPCSTPAPIPSAGEDLAFTEAEYERAIATEPRQLALHGEHWLLAGRDQLQALKLNADGSASVATAALGEVWQDSQSLQFFTTATAAITLATSANNIFRDLPGGWLDQCLPQQAEIKNGTVRLGIADLQNLDEELPELKSIEIDGKLVASIKSGDYLHLVTRFDPWFDGLVFESGTSDPAVRAANEAILDSTALEQWLPQVHVDGESAPLSDTCLLQDPSAATGLNTLLNITTLDLKTHELVNSLCVSGRHSGLEINESALYLTATAQDNKHQLVHRFALTEAGAVYDSHAVLDGIITTLFPERAMAPSADQLWVLTQQLRDDGWQAQLQVLEPHEDELSVTQIPLPPIPSEAGYFGVHAEADFVYLIPAGNSAAGFVRLPAAVDSEEDAFQVEIPVWTTRRLLPIGEGVLLAESGDRYNDSVLAQLYNTATDPAAVVAERDTGVAVTTERGSLSTQLWSLANAVVEALDHGKVRVARPVLELSAPVSSEDPPVREIQLQVLEVDVAAPSIEVSIDIDRSAPAQ